MIKYFFFLSVLLSSFALPQIRVKIHIENSLKQPIIKVNFFIASNIYQSNSDGNIYFSIPKGIYPIKIKSLGYKEYLDTININENSNTFNFILTEDVFNLNNVVVTGTYSPHSVKSSPISLNLITAKEIENSNLTINDVLVNNSVNIELKNTIARTQALQMNGFNANHVLILVDGERLAGKMDGTIDLNFLSFMNIDRIEIVKGPFSSLYGSDALGGVINIITKNSYTTLPTIKFQTKFSSSMSNILKKNNQNYFSSNNLSTEAFSLFYSQYLYFNENFQTAISSSLSYDYNKQTDYNIKDNFYELPETKKYGFAIDLNNKIFEKNTIKYKFNYSIDSLHWLSGDYYNPFRNKVNNKRIFHNLSFEHNFSTTSKIYLSQNISTYDHIMKEFYNWNTLKYDKQDEYVNDFKMYYQFVPYSSSLITFGIQQTFDKIISERIVNNRKTQVANIVFFEDEWNLSKYTLNFGIRYSNNSNYGEFVSPKISVLYKFDENFLTKFSYGKGFREPSLKELYINYTNASVGYTVLGEPNLKPEKSDGFNISFEYYHDDIFLIKNFNYYNKLTNLIDYYYKNSNTLSYYNINKATIAGSEFLIDYKINKDLKFNFAYNYTYAVNQDNKKLPFRSPQTVLIKVNYEAFKNHFFKLSIKWYDKKIVNDEQVNKDLYQNEITRVTYYQNAYYNLDFSYSTSLNNFDLTLGINNLTDQYQYPFGNIKGREIFLNIIYKTSIGV